ncbi:rhodanese-like domain-containing protein [Yoonia sp. R2331]|uniref:rhodanese-like domain-containing protein n=1 Tax=Yoonia sp. R2331 TaxID=3237238 RepID=UPI0034E4C8F9
MMLRRYLPVAAVALLASTALAQDSSAQNVAFDANAAAITQAPSADLARLGPLTARPAGCGTVCLSPTLAGAGVATVGEPEVIRFLSQTVANGGGLLIDARNRGARDGGAIAGSTNIPVAVLQPDNPYRVDILMALGAQRVADRLTFDTAAPVMIYDSGPADDQATALVAALLDAGYPADRITYYRGGMLVWVALGLSVAETAS